MADLEHKPHDFGPYELRNEADEHASPRSRVRAAADQRAFGQERLPVKTSIAPAHPQLRTIRRDQRAEQEHQQTKHDFGRSEC